MKKIFTLISGIVFSLSMLNAQDPILGAPPEGFSYKANITKTLTNGNIVAVPMQTIGLKISIVQGDPGTEVYSETFHPKTNPSGQIDIVIGLNGNPPFSSIPWATGIFFLRVYVDLNGGNVFVDPPMSSTQLLSVPYSMYSGKAGFALSADYNSLTNKPITDGSQTKITAGTNITIEGTGTVLTPYIINSEVSNLTLAQILANGNDAGGKIIKNLGSPVENGDAVPKSYFDELVRRVQDLEGLINGSTVNDYEGNIYKNVTIGTQIWMVENLKTTRLNDGTPLTLITDPVEWNESGDLRSFAYGYCWYNNQIENKDIYGGLYNKFVYSNSKICPVGWHVPKREEWQTLIDYVGQYPGIKLKETGDLHWFRNDERVTNESGFTALPGGWREGNGIFEGITRYGYWVATMTSPGPGGGEITSYSYVRLSGGDQEVFMNPITRDDYNPGLSIRCIKNPPPEPPIHP